METLLLISLSAVFASSAAFPPGNKEMKVLLILQKYGYIGDSAKNMLGSAMAVSEDTFRDALREYQRYAGLKQTGKLDGATLDMMRAPRCGVKDKVGPANSVRKKRYALQGSKWDTTSITYKISKYSNRATDRKKTKRELVKALHMWSEVTPLDFIEKKRGEADIDIRFEQGEHGDGDPFDGLDNTLAHAYFPEFGGDVHFDDDEKWTLDDEKTGTNLFQIAAHEFGHSLGLSHSDNTKALMNPYPPWKYKPTFQLHADDIKAIQTIYGSRDKKPQTMKEGSEDLPSNPDISGAPDLCKDSSIDTVTRTEDGSTYFFKGDFYWKVVPKGIAKGYPRRISDDWDGLPGNLDASFTRSNGKTFFFKGTKFWRFTDRKMDDDYPKLLNARFKGIPSGIDAAFDWSGNDKIYFIKGPKFWRYDSTEPHVNPQFPKSLNMWKGLPNHIDAAFQWKNGHTYFFNGNKYYKFNDKTFGVDAGDPPYPRLTSAWWFGC